MDILRGPWTHGGTGRLSYFVPDLKKLICRLKHYNIIIWYLIIQQQQQIISCIALFTKLEAYISSYLNTFVTVDGVSGLTAQNNL